MPRVKRGTQHVKRRKSLLAKTKGMMWRRKSSIRLARPAVLKAGVNAYRDRRNKNDHFAAFRRPYQCSCSTARSYLQPPHRRASQSKHRT